MSIDAADPGSHGYLRYHVEAAVAYTRALDVDAGRASALAVLALGVAAVVSWVAGPLPAAPAVGAGLALAVPAIVNRLAARGRAISLSRWDVPTRR